MHLIAGARSRGQYVEYRWQGVPLRSRMLLQLEPAGAWHIAKSFEFDVRPKLKFQREPHATSE